jgi:hypothetical protein
VALEEGVASARAALAAAERAGDAARAVALDEAIRSAARAALALGARRPPPAIAATIALVEPASLAPLTSAAHAAADASASRCASKNADTCAAAASSMPARRAGGGRRGRRVGAAPRPAAACALRREQQRTQTPQIFCKRVRRQPEFRCARECERERARNGARGLGLDGEARAKVVECRLQVRSVRVGEEGQRDAQCALARARIPRARRLAVGRQRRVRDGAAEETSRHFRAPVAAGVRNDEAQGPT